MRIIADLHVHSKYALATSRNNDLDGLARGAVAKGIGVMATGDFTHPAYFNEIRAKLDGKDGGSGLYAHGGVRFILSTEISLIYGARRGAPGTQHGTPDTGHGTLRMHHVVLAPSLEVAGQINDALGKRGNLASDGRPILGLSSPEFADVLFSLSPDIMIIPAHAWTPWFSVFGSMSGVNTIEQAFEDRARDIFAIETGLSCYDDETEILTENGWKRAPDVGSEDMVCTLNQKKGRIEYQKAVRTFKYRYNGKMYRLKTKRADLCVTPNHNLYYRPCDFRNRKPYGLAEARFLFGKSKIFKKDGKWMGKRPKYFTLPAVDVRHGSRFYSGFRRKPAKRILIEPWLRFFGFWIAEGWVSGGEEGDYNVCVSNNKKELLDEMRAILESFGYSVYQGKNIIRARDFQLFHYLKQFGKASGKFIPPEIKSLSPDLLTRMFDYYVKGDGHRYGRNGKGLSATTISKRLRDDLQELALKLGMSAYYKLHNPKGTPFSSPSQKKQYYQSADSWLIFFVRKNEHIVMPSTIKKYDYIERWEDYNGHVYCVEVPNHVIYIRRNGIPLWCGNSDPAMNWTISKLDRYSLVSNSDAHSLDNLGREANVFDLNEASYRAIRDAIRTRKGFVKTYEFYPEEGKYHYDGHRDCGVRWSPWETKSHGGVCTVCRKPVTVGVLNRVAALADRKSGFRPEGAVPFQYVVPLRTVISKTIGKGERTGAVFGEYDRLVRYFGSEFAVFEADDARIRLATTTEIANAVIKAKNGNVRWLPGYDGVFGELILDEKMVPKEAADKKQTSLGDF